MSNRSSSHKRIWIAVSVLLVVAIIISVLFIFIPSNKKAYAPSKLQSSWMQCIKDDAPITKLAIPGTHDSGTKGMMVMAETQGADIKTQLQLGARYFDIRVHDDGNGGVIFHGPIKKNAFQPIAGNIKSFMDTHPSEFLILDFQHFGNGADKLVYNTLKKKGLLNIAVSNDTSMSDIDYISSLTMQDVRGKVLIFFGSDMADKYKNIFRRNNDGCTLKNASLDSLYIGEHHKKGPGHFLSEAMPLYFKHILSKKKGILVLQGQLTSPLVTTPKTLEDRHNDGMSKYTRNINKSKDKLEYVNVVMRDFFEQDKEKCLSILSLNYYKGYIKDEYINKYRSTTEIK